MPPLDLRTRLDALRTRRLAEDERLVCLDRARILAAGRVDHAGLPRIPRQAAILRDLCEQIPIVLEPEDVVAGRMPEVIPTDAEEVWVAEHPELFTAPGVPGWFDGLSIYVPDWESLLRLGLRGLAEQLRWQAEHGSGGDPARADRLAFATAGIDALDAVSGLIGRYARAAEQAGRADLAERCRRVAWEPPARFVDGLQLLQLVHLTLACLVGGRDVTPGRLDQYLLPLYRAGLAGGELARDEAVTLLAMFFLRLSQMGGNGTDFDDNLRRSPCQYSHLYVTVGGVDRTGKTAVNELSFAVLDAIERLDYKEPTVLVRWHDGIDRRFVRRAAELVRDRRPVTIYCDQTVLAGLDAQGVTLEAARDYAHSACHNVVVAGQEAGTGVGGFHNLPGLLLRALDAGPASFEALWDGLRGEVRAELAAARAGWERRWREEYEPACPLLASCLLPFSLAELRSCWAAAPVSHFNHYLMGLATTVDSLLAVKRLVFEERRLSLAELRAVLADDWQGHEALRQEVRTRVERYGQGAAAPRELAGELGRLWVDEVAAASAGLDRHALWPGLYSHMSHVHAGARTPATPDGRRAGESLSENVSPSYGTPGCSPTGMLADMAALPLDRTASGAATLTLPAADLAGEGGPDRLVALLDGYFQLGGLHLQVNVLDGEELADALAHPERHTGLMVRVTGFSAYFTRLSRAVQEDVVRRYQREAAG